MKNILTILILLLLINFFINKELFSNKNIEYNLNKLIIRNDPIQGNKGDLGNKGNNGPAGPSGPQGPRGDSGPRGGKGERGNKGIRGKSIKGPRGLRGSRGKTGKLKNVNTTTNSLIIKKKKLCIGATCIDGNDLKKLIGNVRYVRIECKNPFLQLSEVEVYAKNIPNNIALNKKTSQSSTGWGGNSRRAVDGNKSGHYSHKSTSHTNDHNSWWEIDLGLDYSIRKIVIYTRTDCCQNRINNSLIRLLDSNKKITKTINYGSAKYRKEFNI